MRGVTSSVPISCALEEVVAATRTQHGRIWLGLAATEDWARLPWESLRLPRSGPVALDSSICFYRRVAGVGVLPPRPGPLRILVAISSPATGGGYTLDYEHELRSVLKAVRSARASRADVRVVLFATTTAIREALDDWPAHILHLSGHGAPGVLDLQ
jgi:hypothetical protein